MKKSKIVFIVVMAAIVVSAIAATSLFLREDGSQSEDANHAINVPCSVWSYDRRGGLQHAVDAQSVSLRREAYYGGTDYDALLLTVDNSEWVHFRGTLVVAPSAIRPVEGSDPILKQFVVVISTRGGASVFTTQGDDCSMRASRDLPDTTIIHVDGKTIFAYDAEVDIIPASLMGGAEI